MIEKNHKLTPAQLAFLMEISEFTLRKLVKNEEIPKDCVSYVSGRLMFNLDRLLVFFGLLEGGAT